MTKTKDILIFIFALGVILAISFTIYALYDIQEKYASEPTEPNSMIENKIVEFDLLDYKLEFDLIINEYYLNKNAIGHAVGYDLFIGNTTDSLLPKNLTVLSFSELNKKINLGDTIRFLPNDNQYDEKNGFGLYYYTNDTIINGKIETYILGSQNKAIWADPKPD